MAEGGQGEVICIFLFIKMFTLSTQVGHRLAKLDIGVMTLGCVPIKSVRRDEGQLNIDITFGGVTFRPGEYVYADNNGVIVAPKALL